MRYCDFILNTSEVNVKRKIVSYLLISLLLFSIGCHSTGMLTKEDLKAKPEQGDITVVTKTGSEYKFLNNNYHIQNDTLTGFGSRTLGSFDEPFQGSIPFTDITSFKTERFNVVGTSLVILVPLAIIGGALLALAAGLANP
jgi:hypothetical protein